jgi:hypothetical protein
MLIHVLVPFTFPVEYVGVTFWRVAADELAVFVRRRIGALNRSIQPLSSRRVFFSRWLVLWIGFRSSPAAVPAVRVTLSNFSHGVV